MSTDREQLLEHFLALYGSVATRVLQFRRSSHWIDLAVLAMSILTAGSLWVLISDHFVVAAKWIGATIATSLAFLTSYQKAFGPSKLLEEARALHRDIGGQVAALRDHKSGENLEQYWTALKSLESRLLDLGGTPAPPPGLTKAQEKQWREQRSHQ